MPSLANPGIGVGLVLGLVLLIGLGSPAAQAFADPPTAPKAAAAPAPAASASTLSPAPKPLVTADTVRAVRILPETVVLRGPDAVQQLVVEGQSPDGAWHDVTGQARFSISVPDLASIDASGLILPKRDGVAAVRAEALGKTVDLTVTVTENANGRPMNFANDVVPVFTKLSCNSGACHGKASGQNGFRLSLLGFEPDLDYETLVHEGRGRRLFPAHPESSLLLTKGAAQVPHGGGKRLEPGSREYQVLVRWIRNGLPAGKADDPVLARIKIYPESRVLTRQQTQQLLVTAEYSDGRTEDITRWVRYQSNDTDVAEVADSGLIKTRDMAGQAAIMARYQGQVAVFIGRVPLGLPITGNQTFQPKNIVDTLAKKQWDALGLVPSEPCTDAEYLRRVSVDITGTLPNLAEMREFLADTRPNKRDLLVDRLLERPEYANYFAIKWSDILKNKRQGNPAFQRATHRFHTWIRDALAQNMPYSEFTRAIIAGTGSTETAPAVFWTRQTRAVDMFVDDSAQVFLGMRLQCAKCHHHPFEKWSQADYYSYAAFFGQIGRKPAFSSRRHGNAGDEVIFNARAGEVSHPKTGQVMKPKGLGGPEIVVGRDDDRREHLVDWLTQPDNPFFAPALVNRYWSHFFGRGLVEAIDDIRMTNPASNPDLLAGLAKDFVDHGFDLKQLIRTICTSQTYGLSSIPNEYNLKDKQSFARHYPKRMSAEVLLDAIARITEVPTPFNGLPGGTRAIELPDESVGSTFLDTFGRPKRDTACECERISDASLGQSLMLLNSGEVQGKLTAANGSSDRLAKDPRPEPEKIDDLFRSAFGRPPTRQEQDTALAHIKRLNTKKKEAYEDILWALINSKEFQFID